MELAHCVLLLFRRPRWWLLFLGFADRSCRQTGRSSAGAAWILHRISMHYYKCVAADVRSLPSVPFLAYVDRIEHLPANIQTMVANVCGFLGAFYIWNL